MTGEPKDPCRVADRFGEILLREEILRLAGDRHARILAHACQPLVVRGCADTAGDDLELLMHAGNGEFPVLVVCAPYEVAETIQLLVPGVNVIIPVPSATCPEAGKITPARIDAARDRHPAAAVVVDVRSSAPCKIRADITSTREMLPTVIASLETRQVILALPSLDPDCSWEDYVPGKEVLPLVACVRDPGDTPGAGDRTGRSRCTIPRRPASGEPATAPAEVRGFFPRDCTNCHGMRRTTLQDLHRSLRSGGPRVDLDEETVRAARRPVVRMMALAGRRP